MDQRFGIARVIRRAVISLGGNCGHRLPFTVKKPSTIRIFAALACPERTIEASFACVWVLAAHRALGLFVNLPDPAAPASCGLSCGKTPAPGKSHAEDKPGAARFKSADTVVHDHAHFLFPRVAPATLAFLQALSEAANQCDLQSTR
jgi:hypothetical protein